MQPPAPTHATPTPQTGPGAAEALELVRDEVDGEPETYAGAYLDQTTGDLVILVATDSAEKTATVRELIPDGTPLVWRRVARSAATLQQVHDDVVALWSDAGVARINHVAIDVPSNTVIVSMPSLDDPLASQIEARFHDAVRIVVEPPSDPI